VDTCVDPCQVQDSRRGTLPDLSQRTDRTSCDGFYNNNNMYTAFKRQQNMLGLVIDT